MDDIERAIADEIARTQLQIANLEESFDAIVHAAELTSTDDEHDPEGATIAYERAQVAALLRQAREDLEALRDACERAADGTIGACAACGGPILVARLLALPGVRTCIGCAS
jgi:RNA polymerase-binding transcription factor DksA